MVRNGDLEFFVKFNPDEAQEALETKKLGAHKSNASTLRAAMALYGLFLRTERDGGYLTIHKNGKSYRLMLLMVE